MRRQEESWRTKGLSSKAETKASPRHAQGQHAFAQYVACDLSSKGPIGGDAPSLFLSYVLSPKEK